MEFIRKNLVQIREQLKNLTASQRILFALIILMFLGSLYWMLSYTAKPETIALFDQSMSEAEMARIENKLDEWGVWYKVEGGKIKVKRQERDRLFARLGMDRSLPSDMSETWKKLVLETDMWLPQEDRQNRWQLAKEQRLSQIIGLMDNIEQAHVIINAGSNRVLSDGPSSDPSAAVSITMQSGAKPSKNLVLAVADLVSGAVDKLARDRVNIIVDSVPYNAPDKSSPFTQDTLELSKEHEKNVREKIELALGIPGALVAVFVELDTESVQSETTKYGEPPLIREKTIEDISEQKNISGEPGVRPNTGSSIPTEQAGEKSSKTETENEFSTQRDLTHTIKKNLPGTVKSIRATVNLPNSYFKDIYKQQTGKDATAADLDPFIASESKIIQNKILPIINASDPLCVAVGRYYDKPLVDPVAIASSAAGAGLAIEQYAKPAGLVVLALGSFLTVMMMLKKASAHVGVPSIEHAVTVNEPPPMLDIENGPIGEAGSSEGVLQGVEVDEQTLRMRKMAEQVATLVKEDPSSAASMVRQWIIKDR